MFFEYLRAQIPDKLFSEILKHSRKFLQKLEFKKKFLDIFFVLIFSTKERKFLSLVQLKILIRKTLSAKAKQFLTYKNDVIINITHTMWNRRVSQIFQKKFYSILLRSSFVIIKNEQENGSRSIST